MKKDIKQSEARILVYLSVVHFTRRHVSAIANKLEMDYTYALRMLSAMIAKGWLRKHKHHRFMYYDLTATSPLELAKKAYNSDDLQQRLQTDTIADPEYKDGDKDGAKDEVSERTAESDEGS
jgi:DNA-binding MarR family transcriptional regulator